ncbi:MAG: hypothetical protein AB1453_14245, partial [Chloroflexota bacterium]
MDEEQKDPQENDSLENTQPTQPGERLRRLVSSAQDGNSSVLKGGTGPLPHLPSEPGEDKPRADEPGSALAGMDEGKPQDEPLISERHPTGDPDETAGWFNEHLEQVEKQEGELDTAALSRHPTGEPEATGGWFGEGLEHLLPEKDDEPTAQTRPSAAPVAASADEEVTRVAQPGKPVPPPPPYGSDQAALPRRVDEVDAEATRVTPAAYHAPSLQTGRKPPATNAAQTTRASRPAPPRKPSQSAPGKTTASISPPSQPNGNNWKKMLGCVARLLIGFVFVIVILGVLAGSLVVVRYFTLAASLPSVEDLRGKASQFETTRLLDRN